MLQEYGDMLSREVWANLSQLHQASVSGSIWQNRTHSIRHVSLLFAKLEITMFYSDCQPLGHRNADKDC